MRSKTKTEIGIKINKFLKEGFFSASIFDYKLLKIKNLFVLAFSALINTCIFSSILYANPQNGNISAGSASITSKGNHVEINQTSNKAIINWQSFNIQKNESTHFQQPAGGITLNRINPTQGVSGIYGKLTATGQIILINPAGIHFGPSAFVNVGGLIATTSNISDKNFMQGNYSFNKVDSYSGAIVNEGQIIAKNHGLVALVAPSVVNKGLIEANMGQVILASGNAFTISFANDGLINFSISEPTNKPGKDKDGKILKDGVDNTGRLIANGGKILVTGKSAAKVLDNVINMKGIAEAKSIGVHKGEIILLGEGEKVKVTGKLIASGKQKNEVGGKIKILGKKIHLAKNNVIDVSGDKGGGEVLIGGDYQGKNKGILNADQTIISNQTSIYADALTEGDGGKVIIWADDATQFNGNIFARGGNISGNGGFVETSGKEFLSIIGGRVNASAAKGEGGSWLLDPRNVTIAAATVGGAFSGGNPDIFTPILDNATVDALAIITALNLGIDVTITTGNTGTQAGNITVSNAITKTINLGSPTLTLSAAGTITINNTISSSAGPLNINLSGSALTLNSAVTTNGGNFVGTLQNAVTLTNSINVGAGTISIAANQDGAGAQTFAMNAGSSLATTNTGGSAVSITTNTGVGGTGATNLRNITTGTGGSIVISGNRGNITQTAGTLLNTDGGSLALSTTTGTATSIGTSGANILANAATIAATAGSSGIFINNSGTSGLALGAVNTTGAFSLNSASSTGITQTDAATVTGTTTIVAGSSQNVTLNNAANNFGTLVLTSANNATIVDTNTLILGAGTVSGALDVTAGGSITQSGVLNVTGQPTFTVSTALSDILLSTQANSFNTTPIFTANGNIRDLGLRNILATAAVPSIPSGVRNLTLTFNNAGMTLPAATLTGTLTATAADQITQSGAISGTTLTAKTLNNAGAGIDLATNTNSFTTINLQVRDAADSTDAAANINYLDADGFGISGLRTAANATLTSSGAMTDSGAIVVGGITSLDAGAANNITLNTATNDFNSVNIANANAVTLVDTNAIDLGTSNLNSTLNVTAGGAITQSGLLTIAGASTFNAGATNDITLDSFNNDFSSVGITSGNNVKLLDSNALALRASTVSGNYDVTAGGSITQSGVLTVTGTPTFTLTSALTDVSLASQANNFAITPIITNNGNVQDLLLRNINASASVPVVPTGLRNLTLTFNNAASLTLPAVTLAGNLSTTANGPITQSGSLIVNGASATATFVAGAANDITLNNSLNDFTTVAITSGNNVILRDVNDLNLGTANVSGNYTITTDGAITQSGTQTIAGTTTLDAGANNITLATSTNNFNAVSVLNANNVNIRDTNSLILDGINAAGTFTVRTNGNLTQSGLISASGLTTITAGATNNVSLDTFANDFSSVSIVSGNDVSLSDANALILSTATVSGLYNISAGGSITQNGVLNITGTPTFTLTGPNSDISLASNANVFATTPVITNNGNVRDLLLRNTDATAQVPSLPAGLRNLSLIFNNAAMSLPGVSLTGDLTATASGAITQTGALEGTNLIAKTLDNAGADITLSNANNRFSTIDLQSRNAADSGNAAGAITFINDAGFDIAGLATTNTANLTANGNITQSGSITVPGITTLSAGFANDITLGLTTNNFGTIGVLSANNATLRDTNAIILNTSSVTNDFNVTATSITQSGTLTGQRLLAKTLNNAGGAITLDNNSNDFDVIDLQARNAADTAFDTGLLTYHDLNGFDIETIGTSSTSASALSIVANGSITDSGTITVPGTSTFDVGSANNISLNSATNNFGTIGINSANDVTLVDTNALVFAASTINGDLTLNANGTITQSGALTVNGLSTLATAVTSDINLTNVGNDFGSLNITSADDSTIVDSTGLDLAGININDDATFTVGGNLTDSGALTIPGLLTINAGANDISLNTATNTINTVAIPSGNDATIVTVVPIALNASNLNNYTVTSAGTIADSGILAITDTLTVNAVGGITLNNANTITNFNATNSGSGNISLTNTASPLTITGFSQSGGGNVSITNVGTVAIANGVSLNSSNGLITLITGDLNLNATGSINSGTGNTTITSNIAASTIGLGNTAGDMSISGSELQRITAANLTLTAANNGQIVVDNITPIQSDNLNTVTLSATNGTLSSISFINSSSTFKSLIANADNGISISAPVTTTTGAMSLNANFNGVLSGNDSLSLGSILTSAGAITLSAQGGGIVLTAPSQLVANSVTFNHQVNGNNNLTINSGSGVTNFQDTVGATTAIGNGIGAAITLLSTGLTTFTNTVATNSGINAVGPVIFNNTVNLGNGNTGSTFSDGVTFNHSSGFNFTGFDGLSFNGGLTTQNGSMTINSQNSALTIANLFLGNTLTLISGSGIQTINGAVEGQNQTLVLQDNSSASTGSIRFNDDVNLQNLVTFARPYKITFAGATTTFADAITFNNTTGTEFINNGTFNFTNGFTNLSATTLYGTLNTVQSAINLNTLELTGDSAVNTVGGNLTVNSITGNKDLTLNTGVIGDIIFNGNTEFNNFRINNMHDFYNYGEMFATSYIQSAGNFTDLGDTLFTSGLASITGNRVVGELHAASLFLDVNFANLTGTVAGLRGKAAIQQIKLGNTILPNTHFFDGIDMLLPPSPPVPVSPIVPTIPFNAIVAANEPYAQLGSNITNAATQAVIENYTKITPIIIGPEMVKGIIGEASGLATGKVGQTLIATQARISELASTATKNAVTGFGYVSQALFTNQLLMLAFLITIILLIGFSRRPLHQKIQRISSYLSPNGNNWDMKSFELRTSLQNMIGFADLLYQGKVGNLSVEQKDFIAEILMGSKGILALINHKNKTAFSTQDIFALRTMLNQINGFAGLLSSNKMGEVSQEQKEYLDYILADSNAILSYV